jgi:hypothetical protein
VFLDDKPLTTGRIVFVPEKGGRPSIGNIDERGHFTLTCFDGNDGAVVGKYRIEIVPSKAGGEDGPPSPIPVRYNSQETSGLTADIRGPTGNLKFTIVSERTPTPRDTGPDPRKLRPERQ